MRYELHHGDCLDVLRTFADCSVDAVVTDPPYGLSFMGKKWDYDVPAVEVWTECLRVLKPGGHLLAFAGTRTQHRMAVRIEDAGFEIRDMIAWVYGCLDEDTQAATPNGATPYHKLIAGDLVLCYNIETGEYTFQPILEVVEYDYSDTAFRIIGDHFEQVVSRNHRCIVERGGVETFQEAAAWERETRVPVLENLQSLLEAVSGDDKRASDTQPNMLKGLCGCDDWNSQHGGDAFGRSEGQNGQLCGVRCGGMETERMVKEIKQANVQQAMQRKATRKRMGQACAQSKGGVDSGKQIGVRQKDERIEQSIMERRCDVSKSQGQLRQSADQIRSMSSGISADGTQRWLRDGASVNGCNCDNIHSTVKPTDLMRYLCRLVTPPNGLILDPFMGSGSTGKAAMIEGFRFIGIEREAEYLEIAQARIAHAVGKTNNMLAFE